MKYQYERYEKNYHYQKPHDQNRSSEKVNQKKRDLMSYETMLRSPHTNMERSRLHDIELEKIARDGLIEKEPVEHKMTISDKHWHSAHWSYNADSEAVYDPDHDLLDTHHDLCHAHWKNHHD